LRGYPGQSSPAAHAARRPSASPPPKGSEGDGEAKAFEAAQIPTRFAGLRESSQAARTDARKFPTSLLRWVLSISGQKI